MPQSADIAAGAADVGVPSRVGFPRLALFATGDFAFNLYWQSAMLYLLFYYTEAIHIPIREASACYAIASVWDGIASLGVGMVIGRFGSARAYRTALIVGAVPLGFTFALAYAPPPVHGSGAIAWVLISQLLFRTLYALTNIPYLAMSARISGRSDERSLVAGGRMIAGTLAAVTVAVATLPLGHALSGASVASAYVKSAVVFSAVASALLIVVGLTYRDAAVPTPSVPPPTPALANLFGVWRNPALVWLSAAMVAMIIAATVLDRSVLYYFKYTLGDQTRGQLMLGAMMAVSGLAVPFWLMLSRWIGLRGVWIAAIATCFAALTLFIAAGFVSTAAVQIFLIVMQAAAVGLNFALWALLPETIDLGRRLFGIQGEAIVYGWSALLQRIAIGMGTLLLGLGFGAGGPNGDGPWLRLSLTIVPLGFFALSGLIMLINPFNRLRAA